MLEAGRGNLLPHFFQTVLDRETRLETGAKKISERGARQGGGLAGTEAAPQRQRQVADRALPEAPKETKAEAADGPEEGREPAPGNQPNHRPARQHAGGKGEISQSFKRPEHSVCQWDLKSGAAPARGAPPDGALCAYHNNPLFDKSGRRGDLRLFCKILDKTMTYTTHSAGARIPGCFGFS